MQVPGHKHYQAEEKHAHLFTLSTISWIGFFAAPSLALIVYLILPKSYLNTADQLISFGHEGRVTAAIAVWMAIWWMTEAIPVYATALLPLVLLPLFKASRVSVAAAPYAHELIFLFMGGFILALSMERWNLHKRIAFFAILFVGTKPVNIIGGFMAITAILSMWVSNTATTIMMLPIALSIIALADKEHTGGDPAVAGQPEDSQVRNFSIALLLGIAYAVSIGGIGTLIGTPPNLFLASYIKNEFGFDISFVKWMGVGLPLVIIFLPIVWILLTGFLYPFHIDKLLTGSKHIRGELAHLGTMKPGEWATFIVFVITATMWVLRPILIKYEIAGYRPLSGLSDTVIAITAALILFTVPVNIKDRVFVMNWETAAKLPWGLLILFGGGLSLAAAIKRNGVGEFIGNQVDSLGNLPSVFIVILATTMMIVLTELTSNTATTATLVPILAGIAPGLGFHPYVLIIPATIAASCAFMLPVATPPNAIVFGSGQISIPQMCKAGIFLNMIGLILIVILTYAIAIPLLGAQPP